MSTEEISEEYELTDDDDGNSWEAMLDRKKRIQKNRGIIDEFLGTGPHAVEAYEPVWYYWGLSAWATKCVLESSGWKIVSVLGYYFRQPFYRDVQIDYTKFETCLVNGQMLMEKDGVRLVITVSNWPGDINVIQIESAMEHKEQIKQLIQDITDFQKKNNFYRVKRISLDKGIFFVTAGPKDWASVILDPDMKKEIRLNTIDFLKIREKLEKRGVPLKRGIILSGPPGTGKTAVCKALMWEGEGITRIVTSAYAMVREEYISDLFAIAQELSPAIIFIEDLDFVAGERSELYRGRPALIALLAEMDGIEEKKAIVTVATTNGLETLDKALSERPSRFDRVFKLGLPKYQQRTELLRRLAVNNPLSPEIIEYIAKSTEGFTPAQLQEVLYGMVISHAASEEENTEFTRGDVDAVIALITYRKTGKIGFNT
jgi:cell division protease FtsH